MFRAGPDRLSEGPPVGFQGFYRRGHFSVADKWGDIVQVLFPVTWKYSMSESSVILGSLAAKIIRFLLAGSSAWRVMRGWCPPRSSKPLSRHDLSGGVFDSLPLRQRPIKPGAQSFVNRHEMRSTAECAGNADSNLGCSSGCSVPSVVGSAAPRSRWSLRLPRSPYSVLRSPFPDTYDS